MSRKILSRAHLVSASIGLLTIVAFWLATALSEAFAGTASVAAVKEAILYGMALLVPAMIVAAATGLQLGGRSTAPVVAAKRRRMPVIALNGLLVLVPCAIFLAGKAARLEFDAAFYAVQAVELLAGGINIALMGLNMRDGFRLTRKRRAPSPFSRSASLPSAMP
jgi:hypothetical protein